MDPEAVHRLPGGRVLAESGVAATDRTLAESPLARAQSDVALSCGAEELGSYGEVGTRPVTPPSGQGRRVAAMGQSNRQVAEVEQAQGHHQRQGGEMQSLRLPPSRYGDRLGAGPGLTSSARGPAAPGGSLPHTIQVRKCPLKS